MMNVSIIGAGRVGTSLGYALSKKEYRIKALSCKTTSSAKESRKIIGEGKVLADNAQTAREGDLVFMCLPDEEIKRVTKELAASDIDWLNKYVFHCSGLLTSEILKPLKDQEAFTGSFHPIQAFSQGYGKLVSSLPGLTLIIGSFFGMVMLNAFVLTTLDTGTRLGRFVFSELFRKKAPLFQNRWMASLIILAFAAVLGATEGYKAIALHPVPCSTSTSYSSSRGTQGTRLKSHVA